MRYRATRCPPPGKRICALCGSERNVEVGHIDGHEENGAPQNLIWTCRVCNCKCAHALKRAGLGRPTRQYNPASKSEGAETLGQWMNAVMSIKGDPGGNMDIPDAVSLIHATPPQRRSRFAKEIWRLRRQRGTDTTSIPF